MHFGLSLSFVFTLTEMFNQKFKTCQIAFCELLDQPDYKIRFLRVHIILEMLTRKRVVKHVVVHMGHHSRCIIALTLTFVNYSTLKTHESYI